MNRPLSIPQSPGARGEPAWEVATLFPNQGEWTEADYLALDTNRLVELSDGRLEFLAMPTLYHQLIVDFLHGLLKQFVLARGLGRVFFAPAPLRLWAGKIREPDIFYVPTERIGDLTALPEGADLAVEILSPGAENRRRDLETKREEYAKAHIREYWIVDPQERQITVLVLDGEQYREHGVFGGGETATSVLLDGFAVAVADVFAVGE